MELDKSWKAPSNLAVLQAFPGGVSSPYRHQPQGYEVDAMNHIWAEIRKIEQVKHLKFHRFGQPNEQPLYYPRFPKFYWSEHPAATDLTATVDTPLVEVIQAIAAGYTDNNGQNHYISWVVVFREDQS